MRVFPNYTDLKGCLVPEYESRRQERERERERGRDTAANGRQIEKTIIGKNFGEICDLIC